MHPIDTNLHAASCQRDNASRHPQKQTMPCLIPPCWSRRPARATQHRDSKHTRTKAIANPPPFLRACKTTHQRRSRKDQQGVGRRDLGNEMGHHTLPTPSNKPIWHDLARYPLVRLNRIRTGYGRFNANMNQMGLSPSASCECGATDQTAQHIASECPLHRCKGDLVVLDTAARNWLHDLQCDV